MWQSERNEKDAFAEAWLREPDAFKAAVSVVGSSNAGRALQIAATWVSDDYVLAKQAALLEENGPEAYLPTKFDTARKALDIFNESRDYKTKLEALNSYAKIMGFISKPDQNVNIKGGLVAVPFTEAEMKL
jgi:hypothetical protein